MDRAAHLGHKTRKAIVCGQPKTHPTHLLSWAPLEHLLAALILQAHCAKEGGGRGGVTGPEWLAWDHRGHRLQARAEKGMGPPPPAQLRSLWQLAHAQIAPQGVL